MTTMSSMALPVFSIMTVASAALAILFSDTRKVIIASWIASMSVGALFLACGAEYLAFVQWITGTLVAISFIVYATLFGEYGPVDSRSARERVFDAIPAILVGAAFFGMVMLALREPSPGAAASVAATAAMTGANDLMAAGKNLAERHVLSLELVAFMLLAALIGAGVISRGERPEEGERAEKVTT